MNNTMVVLMPLVIALASSIFLILLFRRIAPRIGLLDQPDSSLHKTHSQPAALVGGISVFTAFCFTLLFIDAPMSAIKPLLAASLILVLTGVLDDLHEVSPTKRFASQIAACMVMIFLGNTMLTDLGMLINNNVLNLSWFSIPFTIFAVVGVINAFNMSDGMDGQAGMLSVSVLVILVCLCLVQGNMQGVVVLSALVGAIIGFLVFNLRIYTERPATVFMGDAGSTLIGFIVSWFLISLSQGEKAVISPMAAVWICGLPICDTLTVMTRRIMMGNSPLKPDRTHYHHILRARGLRINQILMLIVGLTFGVSVLVLWLDQIDGAEKYMFYLYLLFLTGYYTWSSGQIRKYSLT